MRRFFIVYNNNNMKYILYHDPCLPPVEDTINLIQNLNSETYKLILLLGTEDFHKENLFTYIQKSSDNILDNPITSLVPDKLSSNHANIGLAKKNAAEIYIKTNKNQSADIWCLTENLINNRDKDKNKYISTILPYSSKVIFFFELSNKKSLKKSLRIFEKLIRKQCPIDFEVLICIKILDLNQNIEIIKQDLKTRLANIEKIVKTIDIFYIENDNQEFDGKLLSFIESSFQETRHFQTRRFMSDEKHEDAEELIVKTNNENFQEENLDSNPKLSYLTQLEQNYANYLKDNCSSEDYLEDWLNSKTEELNKELNVIQEVFELKKQTFLTQTRFNEFLDIKKFEICSQSQQNKNDIKLTLAFIFEEFDEFCLVNNYNYEMNENLKSILQIRAKDFIYNEIENLKNNSYKNLMKKIDEFHKNIVTDIMKFKQSPYKYNINKFFNEHKADFYKFVKFDKDALGHENKKIFESRIEEYENLILSIRKSAPVLNLELLFCPKCNKKGTIRVISKVKKDIKKFTVFDADSNIKNQIEFKCIKCKEDFAGPKLLNSEYEFEVDYAENVISIRKTD